MEVNEKVHKRLIRTLLVFLPWFFIVAVVSYYVLPEGLLRSTNEIKEIVGDTSPFRLCISIFLRNLIPVLLLGIGCLVAIRINNTNFPFSYLGLFTIFTVNGVTLGTWSFTSVSEAAPPLINRILRTFDIIHRAGLFEMVSLCLVVAALTNAAIVQIHGGKAEKSIKRASFTRKDLICLLASVFLLLCASIVETYSIVSGK